MKLVPVSCKHPLTPITWVVLPAKSLINCYPIVTTALSIKCEFCSNIAAFKDAPSCNETVSNTVDCKTGFDRCGTVTVTMDSAGEPPLQMKNCSNAIACDPKLLNMCEMLKGLLNSTGVPLQTCNYDCCDKDECNTNMPEGVSQSPPNDKPITTQPPMDDITPTGGTRDTAARFGAIFMAFVFSICMLG